MMDKSWEFEYPETYVQICENCSDLATGEAIIKLAYLDHIKNIQDRQFAVHNDVFFLLMSKNGFIFNERDIISKTNAFPLRQR